MSDEEINQAIAEALGRKYHKPTEAELKRGSYYQYEPNYCGDLNAMNQSERCLPATERDVYQDWLARVVDRERRMATVTWLCINSTARQRAEAFLRTLGKWQEAG